MGVKTVDHVYVYRMIVLYDESRCIHKYSLYVHSVYIIIYYSPDDIIYYISRLILAKCLYILFIFTAIVTVELSVKSNCLKKNTLPVQKNYRKIHLGFIYKLKQIYYNNKIYKYSKRIRRHDLLYTNIDN